MTREEVAELAPERSRVIDVEQFVDVAAVDPIYFESRYYLVPDREWSSPFRVLRQAMAAADRMAIGGSRCGHDATSPRFVPMAR